MIERKQLKLEASDEAVLEYMLTYKVAERYKMSKQLNKSYSNVFNAVKRLDELKLITVANTKKSEKNPKIKVEQYELTLTGLVLACHRLCAREKIDINKVAQAHKDDLPLVFGKWSHFIDHGKQQSALERLQLAIDERAIHLLAMDDFRKVESEHTKKFCREMRRLGEPSLKDVEYQITLNFLMRDYLIPHVAELREGESPQELKERLWKEWEEWRDVCKLDPEIKAFCEPTARRLIETTERTREYLQKWVS